MFDKMYTSVNLLLKKMSCEGSAHINFLVEDNRFVCIYNNLFANTDPKACNEKNEIGGYA